MATTSMQSSPAREERTEGWHGEDADAAWKPLYRVGGMVALLSAAIVVLAIPIYVISPPPPNVGDWFKLFHQNGLLGLLDFDLLMLIDIVLSGLIYLALFGALRRANQPVMALATAIGIVGIACYVASNTAFNMLTLSNQYASATADAQRAQLLAAGQAMIAIWQGTAYDVGYVLGGVATLIIAGVMLRSKVFGRVTAYVGLAMGVLMLLPATAGPVGLVVSLISLVPTVVWDILIGRRLLQLAAQRTEGALTVEASATATKAPAQTR